MPNEEIDLEAKEKHLAAIRAAGKYVPPVITSEEPGPVYVHPVTQYIITNQTTNRYRFQFNNLRVIFEAEESKIIDISIEPNWKLGLKTLSKEKDSKTNEDIFLIEKLKEVEK